MGQVIDIGNRSRSSGDNVISSAPWEFRKADWETGHFLQMRKTQSARMERLCGPLRELPSCFSLKGGMAITIRSMFAHRENEEKMKQVYYLAGLVDCMINQVNPVLRTDLLRDLYKKVFSLKKTLNIHWHGPLDQVLLPIDYEFHNESAYRHALRSALTLKSLYDTIKAETEKMFHILSAEYVFYCPGKGT